MGEYDDLQGLTEIRKMINNNLVLILAPGKSLQDKKDEIDLFINENDPFIMSVNFISDYNNSIPFFGNKKRYFSFCYEKNRKVIVTSDIATHSDSEIIISAKRLCSTQDRESSLFKILSLVHEIGVYRIAIAGMDGFTNNLDENYYDKSLTVERTLEEIQIINSRWQKKLDEFVYKYRGVHEIKLITPSVLRITNKDL